METDTVRTLLGLLDEVMLPGASDSIDTEVLEAIWSRLVAAQEACDEELHEREVIRAWTIGCEVDELCAFSDGGVSFERLLASRQVDPTEIPWSDSWVERYVH